ncbi:MAG: protein-disulfide reductase DsbD family protein, partial [Rhodothalassiaceae bacterium]
PQRLVRTADGVSLEVARPEGASAMSEARGVLAITNARGEREGFSLEVPVTAEPGLMPAGTTGADLGLWTAAFFAFLGGMILNLMPCVFPVLSLKAFALVKAHGAGRAAARRDGMAYAAGILLSFAVIAAIFLVLRGAGAAIGWGFQLQSPLVVTLLALVLFLVGLSLAGAFTIGARLAGLGQGLAGQGGERGAFFTGVLATLVATPCTAPFMAPAIGFAVFQPTPVALAVFLSLGLGLAAPYLLIAFVPALRRLMPKPGPWLETFRQFLAFPMFLTVIWLLWVLGQEAGSDAVAFALLVLLAAAFLIWLWRKLTGYGAKGGAGVALLAILLGFGLLEAGEGVLGRGTPDPRPAPADFRAALGVEPWSPERLDALRAAGRPVLVYFTADWCITCKVNERVAFADGDVQAFFRAHEIAVLEADWTREDARITQALARFGRNGVPLYLFYPANGGEAVILPQILTPDLLLRRLEQASGSTAAGA